MGSLTFRLSLGNKGRPQFQSHPQILTSKVSWSRPGDQRFPGTCSQLEAKNADSEREIYVSIAQ